jgi:hypothetical protein
MSVPATCLSAVAFWLQAIEIGHSEALLGEVRVNIYNRPSTVGRHVNCLAIWVSVRFWHNCEVPAGSGNV